MKIKTKKQLNLPQLIKWVWDNDVKNERYRYSNSNPYEYVWINENSDVELDEGMCISKNDIFTVEVEEEITEDTVIPTLVMFYENHNLKKVCRFEDNVSISDFQFHEHEVVLAYYILNDDLTMTLIWRDGKLVE